MDLKKLRREIDKTDRDLIRLLDQRAQLAREVARAKSGLEVPTYDPARHKKVIDRVASYSNGAFPGRSLRHVYREILSACLALQAPLKVGYLGPKATFSHLAAVRAFGNSVSFEPYGTVRDIFLAVANGWVDYGIVPIENSMGGIVHSTLDNFLEVDVKVCQEVLLPIQQTLLGTGTIKSIRRIYSHPQGFLQCATWLRENLPRAELFEVASTAMGVQKAKHSRNNAAIASELAADIYNIKILVRDIEDSRDNTTRFLVIADRDAQRPHPDPETFPDSKTSIMFSVEDRPGSLFKLLQPFARKGINLSKIESRPTKRRAWDYVFFTDVDGHIQDPRVRKAIEDLEAHCKMLRILGSYPRDRGTRPPSAKDVAAADKSR